MGEMDALISEVRNPKIRALVALCGGLGLRLSEAGKVRPEDIKGGSVHVRGTKTASSVREVPILSIFAHLVEQARPELPVGPTPNNTYKRLDEARRRAKIDPLSFNDLRRSFCTTLLEHGVPEDITRRFLGHTSTSMVRQVYGRTRPSSLRDQAEAAIQRSR